MTSFDASGLFDIGFFQALGHLSFILLATSFLLRDILHLRLVAIAAATSNAVFSYYGLASPNRIVVFWQSVFVLINMIWNFFLIRDRRGISFTEEERELYGTIFRAFSPLEFMNLMRIARWEAVRDGETLVEADRELDDVILIYDGEAEVLLSDGSTRRLIDGAFIGEMSFIRGGVATTSVQTVQATRYVAWRKADLRGVLDRNPAMRSTMQTVFSEDLTNKLMGGNGGA